MACLSIRSFFLFFLFSIIISFHGLSIRSFFLFFIIISFRMAFRLGASSSSFSSSSSSPSMAFRLGASTSSSSSSSLSIHPRNYDVFLNFRGKDLRQKFISHLYQALCQRGINTYKDNVDLKRGEQISSELFKAIEESRLAITVFSENYAESKWYLDKLLKILECKKLCKQIVLPIFYGIKPSDIREQKGSFGEAFTKLRKKIKDADKKQLESWKEALEEVAESSGFEYTAIGRHPTMSKKKGKEKQKANPLPPMPSIKLIKNESESTPMPSAPSTALDIANRFTPLGKIVQPATFASTVSTTFDPYAKAITSKETASIKPQFFLPKGKSEYLRKPFVSNLFYVEPNRSAYTDVFKIASSYFPPNFHWIPEDSSKNLQYYSSILILTNSLVIKPVYDKNDSTKLIYHSAYILRVMTEEEWGTNPYTPKRLSDTALSFTYFDYITAWNHFMFFQVPDMSHAWFINFDARFKGTFPFWFLQWWNQFGLIPQNFPEQLSQAFKHYTMIVGTKLDRHSAMFPYELHFCKNYKLPWIFKWSYERNANIISRAYFTKWWDKFGYIEKTINRMIKDFPQSAPNLQDKKEFTAIKTGSPAPGHPLIQASTSPTTSQRGKATSSSSKKSSKSKKITDILDRLDKKDLIKILEKQLSKSLSNDSEQDNNSDASSEASYNNVFGHDSEDTPRLTDDDYHLSSKEANSLF